MAQAGRTAAPALMRVGPDWYCLAKPITDKLAYSLHIFIRSTFKLFMASHDSGVDFMTEWGHSNTGINH